MWRIEVASGCMLKEALQEIYSVSKRTRVALTYRGRNPAISNEPFLQLVRNLAGKAAFDLGSEVVSRGYSVQGQLVAYVGPGLYFGIESDEKGIGWIIFISHLDDDDTFDQESLRPPEEQRWGKWTQVSDPTLPTPRETS